MKGNWRSNDRLMTIYYNMLCYLALSPGVTEKRVNGKRIFTVPEADFRATIAEAFDWITETLCDEGGEQ